MSDRFSGKGLMTKAIAKVLKTAPKKLGLIRVFAPILPHNKASARVLEKNGFELEGVSRKYYPKNGKYVNAHCYAWVQ